MGEKCKHFLSLINDQKRPHRVKFYQILYKQNDHWDVCSKPYVNLFTVEKKYFTKKSLMFFL